MSRSFVAWLAFGVVACLLATPAPAQDTVAHRLPVVTVTRDIGRSSLELPFAISEVRPDSARPGQLHTLLDQTLFLLPGVTVANRNNPSQDPRISIRGFGARSPFGVRSIRILRDGMPLTLPDGQTPMDYLDLESVGRVEAIRGTASALYGNASGGIIDIRSAPPPAAPFAAQARSWVGSNDSRRLVGTVGGTVGAGWYQANVGRTTSDNFRQYSRQELTNAYWRTGVNVSGTSIKLQGLLLDMPVAENPGALTRVQFERDPRLADSTSIRKRARKAVRQVQVGLSASRPLGARAAGELSAQLYGGTRDLFNPLAFAVDDGDRRQYGGGARATLPLAWGFRHRLTIGIDAAVQNDLRLNWANCNAVLTPTASCPTLPIEKGVLQVEQREIVTSVGPYLRDELRVGDRAIASFGVRADGIRFEVRDRFLADGADDSGVRTLRAVSPMAGIVLRVAPLLVTYVNVGSAFETPTTTELGNQPNGNAGLNRELKPQFSTTYEAGLKGLFLTLVQYDLSVFNTSVRDELIPFEVPSGNGRTFFRNAGRTRRSGVEAEAAAEVGPLSLAASYTFSHFRFRDFAATGVQYRGNAIPGIPEHQFQASTTWRYGPLFATLEGLTKSGVFVDDANSARTDAFAVFNARLGGIGIGGLPWLSPVVSVQNLLDRRYVGSVAVNAAGTPATAKAYEPAPGRTVFLGLSIGAGR